LTNAALDALALIDDPLAFKLAAALPSRMDPGDRDEDAKTTGFRDRSDKPCRKLCEFLVVEDIDTAVCREARPRPATWEDRDIFERLYAVRLDRLRTLEECRLLLALITSGLPR
jgi:hypothetical protein